MEKQNLMTILIQTGFNIERIFQDKAIKQEAYNVLKYRNDLAISELKAREAETNNDERGLSKHDVIKSVCPRCGDEHTETDCGGYCTAACLQGY